MSNLDGVSDREAAIRRLFPLVRQIARRVRRMVAGVELDDLVGDGSIGLIRAVDNFDPMRGPTLEHYASRLIAGAMLNGIRRMDPVSERARRAVRDGENERFRIAVARGCDALGEYGIGAIAHGVAEHDTNGFAALLAAQVHDVEP